MSPARPGDVEIEILTRNRSQRLCGRGRRAVQHLRQLVVLDDDPLGLQLRGELELLHHLLVGRIRAADEEPAAAPRQHHHLVLRRQLGVDHVLGQALRIHRVEIQHRQGQGRGQRVRQFVRRDHAAADHRADEADLLLTRLAHQILGRLGRQLAGMDQHAGNAGQGGVRLLGESGIHGCLRLFVGVAESGF